MENFCCCNNRFAKKSLTEKKNGREKELTGTKTSQEDRERARALLEKGGETVLKKAVEVERASCRERKTK